MQDGRGAAKSFSILWETLCPSLVAMRLENFEQNFVRFLNVFPSWGPRCPEGSSFGNFQVQARKRCVLKEIVGATDAGVLP